MKHLFWILVFLNLLVFGGMIASKMLKQHMPAEARVQQAPPAPTIIIQSSDLVKAVTKSASEAAAPNAASAAAPAVVGGKPQNTTSKRDDNKNKNTNANTQTAKQGSRHEEPRRPPVVATGDQAPRKSKECSARVSMPEDDFHRIKGLLGNYPHAASRQVVDNGNGDSTARMNVVFMNVNDQQASAIQGIVGRYGQLNRSACNR